MVSQTAMQEQVEFNYLTVLVPEADGLPTSLHELPSIRIFKGVGFQVGIH